MFGCHPIRVIAYISEAGWDMELRRMHPADDRPEASECLDACDGAAVFPVLVQSQHAVISLHVKLRLREARD